MRPQTQIVFEGQSLLNIAWEYPVPWHVGQLLTKTYAIRNAAISGTPMSTRIATVAERVDACTYSYETNVCVLMQLQSEVIAETISAADISDESESWATARFDAGFDYVFAVTVPAIGTLTGVGEAIREELNDLMVASTVYTGVVDLRVDPNFEDAGSDYYVDGLHFLNAGGLAAAELIVEALASVGVT